MIVIDCDEEMYLVSVPSVNIIYFILLLCRCSDGDINDSNDDLEMEKEHFL